MSDADYKINVSYDPLDEAEHPDAVGEPTIIGAPPPDMIAHDWSADFIKEMDPANLHNAGAVAGMKELMADNQRRRELNRELTSGKLGPAGGAPALIEAAVPFAVHSAMEEKHGRDWYQDDELFAKFLINNPGYTVYEWRQR